MRGYMLRQRQRAEARAAAPCDGCGQALGEHRELPRETLEWTGEGIVSTPNPEHRPLHFHCSHEGCSCVIDLTDGEGS